MKKKRIKRTEGLQRGLAHTVVQGHYRKYTPPPPPPPRPVSKSLYNSQHEAPTRVGSNNEHRLKKTSGGNITLTAKLGKTCLWHFSTPFAWLLIAHALCEPVRVQVKGKKNWTNERRLTYHKTKRWCLNDYMSRYHTSQNQAYLSVCELAVHHVFWLT